jgi:hypothetical protein
VTRHGITLEVTAAMGNTLAVLFVILGGVLVLIPVFFVVVLIRMLDWDRHPRAFILTAVLAAVFRGGWYMPPAVFTVGSLLLAYGVAALAHASRAATLSAVGIALLCSILVWGWYLVRILIRRRPGQPPS